MAVPSIKYSLLAPGKPARSTTAIHTQLAIIRKLRPPHRRPILQIPAQVAVKLKSNPNGGRDACKNTEPIPKPPPKITA